MRARTHLGIALIAVLVAACGSDSAVHQPRIDRAMPDHAPLVGGTVIGLEGAGFTVTDRVLIGGREAPYVYLRDDAHLDVVVPPGDQPGDVEVVVFGTTGTVTSRDVLHYSTAPEITGVTPPNVASQSTDTFVTLTGVGFVDEDAGEPLILVDDVAVTPVRISDTELTFVAPQGNAFTFPSIEVHNVRGRAIAPRALRYVPSSQPGLLAFPRYGTWFAVFHNPVDGTTVPIPARPNAGRFTSVLRDADGEYWAMDSSTRLGRLDLETQTLLAPIAVNAKIPAMARVGNQVIALARDFGSGTRFGKLDLASGVFTTVGTQLLVCCGSYGLTSDGTTVWFTVRQDWTTVYINTIDPDTGIIGTPLVVNVPQGFRVEELRHWNGVLYAATGAGKIITINPQSGDVVELPLGMAFERFSAMELFE